MEPGLAKQVAEQLMAKDALAAHAHDELGISQISTAQPIQAAFTSAGTFTLGAAVPLGVVLAVPAVWVSAAVALTGLACLAILGAVGARAGGAGILKSVVRVTFWGAFAMALTAGIGKLFGAVV